MGAPIVPRPPGDCTRRPRYGEAGGRAVVRWDQARCTWPPATVSWSSTTRTVPSHATSPVARSVAASPLGSGVYW